MKAPFSTDSLRSYLKAQGLTGSEPIQLQGLSGGQSNPTYRISTGAGNWVLRKKPSGSLVPGAHAIDREYRVLKALQGSDVPVPRVLTYCEDESVVGTPFYLMEFLEGRVLVDQSLPGMTPEQRAAIYAEMNRVIIALHAVDWRAAGLEGYGKTGNYLERQIARWSRQTRESTVPVPDAMHKLMDWLPGNVPPGDETTLVHGDFRLDNLVFHPTEARIIGVLDWELSTLGHPLADFSYHCMSWRIPATLWRGIGGLDLETLGIPGESEYMLRYANATGRFAAEHWDFYLAYNLFRIAAILHGIAQRAAHGNAAANDAMVTGAKATPLAEIGWQCALRRQDQRL